jgi:hypothetical protein
MKFKVCWNESHCDYVILTDELMSLCSFLRLPAYRLQMNLQADILYKSVQHTDYRYVLQAPSKPLRVLKPAVVCGINKALSQRDREGCDAGVEAAHATRALKELGSDALHALQTLDHFSARHVTVAICVSVKGERAADLLEWLQYYRCLPDCTHATRLRKNNAAADIVLCLSAFTSARARC